MPALQPAYKRSNIHPHQLALWVGIGSIIMMFVAFTSAYVVRRAAGNWLEFKLPDLFFVNTLVILASSLTLHAAQKAFRGKKEQLFKTLVLTTFALGLVFIALQYKAWEIMTANGHGFTINPSTSFVYVISGLHAAHVLGGLAALTVALVHAYMLPFAPTRRRLLRFGLVVQYWHFVDILWVYLYVFFMLQG